MSPEPKWAGNQPPDESGGGGASSLTELTDVTGEPGFGKAPVDDGSATFPFTRVTTQDDLTAILDAVATVEWHNLELQPGFTEYGQGYAPPRYRLTLNNIVFLEGRITADPPLTVSVAPKPIAQLPPEASPGYTLTWVIPNDGQARVLIEISPAGLISFAGFAHGTATTNWCGLAPIIYSTETDHQVVTKALNQTFAK